LYDEYEEHGINGCVQSKTMLKCAKNNGNRFRHFENISKRCERSNVVAYFFGPPHIQETGAQNNHCIEASSSSEYAKNLKINLNL